MPIFSKSQEGFLELAARKLCAKRGLNANELVSVTRCNGETAFPPRWKLVKDEILDLLNMMEAMDEAEEELSGEPKLKAELQRISDLEDE